MNIIDTAGPSNVLDRQYWVKRARDWAQMALAYTDEEFPLSRLTSNVYLCLKRKLVEDREFANIGSIAWVQRVSAKTEAFR